MEGPQKENGYTSIAHEILEIMAKTPLNGTQFRILFVIWRATYGFHKKEHEISEGFIANATGIHKQQIKRELKSLIDYNIVKVIKQATFSTSRVIQFNKNYNEWVVAKKIPPSEKDTSKLNDVKTGSELVTTPGSELVTQKRYINKNNKKDISQEIFNYYLSLDLKKHNTLTKAMKDSIKKAMKDNCYSVEDCKKLLLRHDKVVKITKKHDYPIQVRGLDEFFGQKAYNAKHLICSEYEDGGKQYEKHKKSIEITGKVTPFIPNFIEREFGQ